MDFQFSQAHLFLLLALLAIPVIHLLFLSLKPTTKRPPVPAGAWPIIGHLPLLATSTPPHIVLGNLADKYGPIMLINLGVHRTLIVSNWKVAKECFTINDRAFANRPKGMALEIVGYNYTMLGFSPYGPYWRHMRKAITLELLSNYRLEKLKHVREIEVKSALQNLMERCVDNNKTMVDMKKWFWDITLNVIHKIIVGKRYIEYDNNQSSSTNNEWRNALKEAMDLLGQFLVSDALPFLRWFDFGGYEKAMKKVVKKMDGVVNGWIEEHKVKKEDDKEDDFMGVMFSILDEAATISNKSVDLINKATCVALIAAASDTTAVTLTWTLSLLLNHPETLKKAQHELDIHVGNERQVQETDINNLVYLQAIIKESFRLYPAVPLLLPHESMEDCFIDGYHIPSGTRLFVNVAKIHRDPLVYENPNEFRPQRFLTTHKDIDVRGQDFELFPFGSGRRICPGISFALQILKLTLANLLHGFQLERISKGLVDMSEGSGLTNTKTTPLEVLVAPRLPSHLYG